MEHVEPVYTYGQKCRIKEAVKSHVKKNQVYIPAHAEVEIVSASPKVAIVRYKGYSYSCQTDNLVCHE